MEICKERRITILMNVTEEELKECLHVTRLYGNPVEFNDAFWRRTCDGKEAFNEEYEKLKSITNEASKLKLVDDYTKDSIYYCPTIVTPILKGELLHHLDFYKDNIMRKYSDSFKDIYYIVLDYKEEDRDFIFKVEELLKSYKTSKREDEENAMIPCRAEVAGVTISAIEDSYRTILEDLGRKIKMAAASNTFELDLPNDTPKIILEYLRRLDYSIEDYTKGKKRTVKVHW